MVHLLMAVAVWNGIYNQIIIDYYSPGVNIHHD